MNSLPGAGATLRQSVSLGIVGRQQQQDLGLQRIGVLELVDEDPREARLEAAPHAGVVAHQIARARAAGRGSRARRLRAFSSS